MTNARAPLSYRNQLHVDQVLDIILSSDQAVTEDDIIEASPAWARSTTQRLLRELAAYGAITRTSPKGTRPKWKPTTLGRHWRAQPPAG